MTGDCAASSPDELPALDDQAGFRAWQERARRGLRLMLGIPEDRVPLDAEPRGAFEWNGVLVERWVFTAEPGSRVPAVLYRPPSPSGRVPAVVLTFGHGGSKSRWQYNFAGQLYARMGLACLALDPIGEEERHARGELGTRAHDPQPVVERADRAGRLIMGKLVFDTMRGVDMLLERDDVDPRRIGVTGNSLGGAKAGWMAALDARLRMAIVSGWAYDDVALGAGKLCTRVPDRRMRATMSWSAFASLPAPDCAVLIMNGDADGIIDAPGRGAAWNGVRRAVKRAGEVYARLGAPERLRAWFAPGGGHRPYMLEKEAMEWIRLHLGAPAMTGEEISALPTVNSGEWCDAHGIELEPLYATELHQRGGSLPDLGLRPVPRDRLACLVPGELGLPEFTIGGWLERVEKDAGARPSNS